ncbi:GntR family transcriptional regulator [Halomonadaceae bacterium KBTZ08]
MQSFKPRETLSEQVARHLENMIAFEQLQSGERVHESRMAKELDVSHGAVREALLMLEKRHLVRNVPRKGAFVTTLDEDFVRSLYEAMSVFLSHTGRKLVRQWQPEDMERLESLYQSMRESYRDGQLMEFLDTGMAYTQASLAYADNYFITAAVNDLWPSAKRCAFVALRQGNRVLEANLNHMRESLDLLRARDEEGLVQNVHDYAMTQCEQVIACLPENTSKVGRQGRSAP